MHFVSSALTRTRVIHSSLSSQPRLQILPVPRRLFYLCTRRSIPAEACTFAAILLFTTLYGTVMMAVGHAIRVLDLKVMDRILFQRRTPRTKCRIARSFFARLTAPPALVRHHTVELHIACDINARQYLLAVGVEFGIVAPGAIGAASGGLSAEMAEARAARKVKGRTIAVQAIRLQWDTGGVEPLHKNRLRGRAAAHGLAHRKGFAATPCRRLEGCLSSVGRLPRT